MAAERRGVVDKRTGSIENGFKQCLLSFGLNGDDW